MLGVVAAFSIVVSGTVVFWGLPTVLGLFTGTRSQRQEMDVFIVVLGCITLVLSAWALVWLEERTKRDKAGRME